MVHTPKTRKGRKIAGEMNGATKNCEVLIAGAGPTGLVLALWLTRFGINVRIVDKTEEPGTTSRALVVHARILEQYQQMGIAQGVIDQSKPMAAANLWVAGRKIARAPFGEMGRGLSPYPYAFVYPQDEHEAYLIGHLEAAGVTVERRTDLLGFQDTGNGIRGRLRLPSGEEEDCEAQYIAGCDGAHSTVRGDMDAGFPGGTYDHMFYVADVQARGEVINGELGVAIDTADFLAIFPLTRDGHARLIGIVREDAVSAHRPLTWHDVSKNVIQRMRIEVDNVNWFSTYHVHHRVARIFHAGRAFLLGDAAHIHSPVGGQGMNTGIGDAINLAWKLAAVVRHRSGTELLETYEPERRAFALSLVKSTDRAFSFVTKDGPLARFVRLRVIPHLIPWLFARRFFPRFMFRTISQTHIRYPDSWLSEGSAGEVKGGDRLPWVLLDEATHSDNFAPLTSMDWQVHVYGAAAADLSTFCAEQKLALHVFPWQARMEKAGLARNALYLVRPDGYVGLADAAGTREKLADYISKRGLRDQLAI
jgi:2-polyprenyl-6-methoxyphenol hydroxylase-like FAD-dependent oxidoreductase